MEIWECKPPGTLWATPGLLLDFFTVTFMYYRMQNLYTYEKVDQLYRDADKSLARPGRKQATATEDFDVHISYL